MLLIHHFFNDKIIFINFPIMIIIYHKHNTSDTHLRFLYSGFIFSM